MSQPIATSTTYVNPAFQQPQAPELKQNFVYPTSQHQQLITPELLEKILVDIAQQIRELNSTLKNRRQHSSGFITSNKQKNEIDNNNKALSTLSHIVLPTIAEAKNNLQTSFTQSDLAWLSIHLNKATKKVSDKKLGSTLVLINTQVKAEWQRVTKYNLYEAKVDELEYLKLPGATKFNEKGVSFGGAFCFLDAPGFTDPFGPYVGGDLGVSRKNQRRTNDENKVYKEKSTSVFALGKGGCNFDLMGGLEANAGGKVKVSRTHNKWKKWKNNRHYVYSKGPKLCWANRHYDTSCTGWSKFKLKVRMSVGCGNELKKYKKCQERACNEQHKLNAYLEERFPRQDLKFTPPHIERIKPQKGHTSIYQGEIRGGGALKTSFGKPIGLKLNGKLEACHKRARIRKYENEPHQFWDIAKESPQFLHDIPPQYLDIFTANFDTSAGLTENLRKLAALIKEYTVLLQAYDAEKANNKSSPSDEQKRLQADKHQKENELGCIGRHEYLYALKVLAGFCQQKYIALPQQTPTADLTELESSLKAITTSLTNPDVVYSKSTMDKCSTAHKTFTKKYSDKETTFELSIPLFTGRVEIFERQRNHSSPLRAGKYWDLTLSGIMALHLQDFSGMDLAESIKSVASSYGHEIPDDFTILPDIGVSGEVSYRIRYFKPEFTEAQDYSGYKGWQKLWTREMKKRSFDNGLGIRGNVHPGVSVGGAFEYHNTLETIMRETIGSNSLVYITMLFNRYFADSGNTAENVPWRTFVAAHKPEFKQILLNIKNKKPEITADLAAFKERIAAFDNQQGNNNSQALDLAFTQLTAAADNFDANPSEQNFKVAIHCLEACLAMQVPSWKQALAEAWTLPEFKHSPPHKFTTKMLLKLGMHQRANAQVADNVSTSQVSTQL